MVRRARASLAYFILSQEPARPYSLRTRCIKVRAFHCGGGSGGDDCDCFFFDKAIVIAVVIAMVTSSFTRAIFF